MGNSRVKLAIFDRDELIHFEAHAILQTENLASIFHKYDIQSSIISATRIEKPELLTFLKANSDFYLFDQDLPLPIRNDYDTPKTLGKDRLAAVVAGNALFPNENVLKIDGGTCITVDFIDATGCYQGGSIHPGLEMRLKALHHFTGKLPLIEYNSSPHWLGKNTKDSILAGSLAAALGEINTLIGLYKSKYGKIRILLTGGNAAFFENQFKFEIFAHPNLVLIGLNKILSFNAK
ncbi:UNVERIFIED_CONTAM: hypothetical protein GTU68_053334 [Idotea baltica]|nr:hypothetical protein [Idotea baltica]